MWLLGFDVSVQEVTVRPETRSCGTVFCCEKHKYHSGVAALYKNLDLPVVPVALNSGLFWPRRHLIRKPGIITLRYLTPILPGLSREAFMSKLETEIEAAQIQINQSTEL